MLWIGRAGGPNWALRSKWNLQAQQRSTARAYLNKVAPLGALWLRYTIKRGWHAQLCIMFQTWTVEFERCAPGRWLARDGSRVIPGLSGTEFVPLLSLCPSCSVLHLCPLSFPLNPASVAAQSPDRHQPPGSKDISKSLGGCSCSSPFYTTGLGLLLPTVA